MGNGLSCFHSLSPFMETLWEQGPVLTELKNSESENEWETEVSEGGRGRKRRRTDCGNAAFSRILWKSPCSVCVLHCAILPLAKATKASIYLSWASTLTEKALKGKQPSHVPGWHGFSLVNTLVLHPECTQHNLHWSEGLLLPTIGEKKR